MIDAMSAPQIEETAEYLAWVERVGSQNEIADTLAVSIETVNRMLAEAAWEDQAE